MSSENHTKEADPFELVTVRCETAKCFLENLDETHERWGDRELWVYRGHNDARWELKPSLYRLLNHHDQHDRDTYKSFEFTLISQFIRNVNLANLPIPSNSLGFLGRQKGNTVATRRATLDPYRDAILYDFTHVVFAIAQHSGIPTRLLSFTFDPFVAAYFAADTNNLGNSLELSAEWKAHYLHQILELFQQSEDPDMILDNCLRTIADKQAKLPLDVAVWAIRVWDLQTETTLRLLDHPTSEILNLRLQRGVFICDIGLESSYENPFKSFNDQLQRLIKSKGVYKVTLPFSELTSLYRLLEKKRRFPALMTPTYESIAKTVFELTERRRQYVKQAPSSDEMETVHNNNLDSEEE